MEKVVIFNGHWEYTYVHTYITANWYMLWPFVNLMAILVYFAPFLVYKIKKNLATLTNPIHRTSVGTFSARTFEQGDQIGRIFASWVWVCNCQIFERKKLRIGPNFGCHFFHAKRQVV
jgi:hypothetical protein